MSSYRSKRECNTTIKECRDRNQIVTVQVETITRDNPDNKPAIDIPQFFTGEKFMDVRAFEIDCDIWFAAKDICEVLGYADHNNAIKRHCTGVAKRHPTQTSSGRRDIRVINQEDVKLLIMGSKLPEAKEFKVWVAKIITKLEKDGVVDLRVNQGNEGRADTNKQYQDPAAAQSLTKLCGIVEDYYGVLISTHSFIRHLTDIVTYQLPDGSRKIGPDYQEYFIMKGKYAAVKWNNQKKAKAWLINHLNNVHGGIDIDRFVIKDRGEKNLRVTMK